MSNWSDTSLVKSHQSLFIEYSNSTSTLSEHPQSSSPPTTISRKSNRYCTAFGLESPNLFVEDEKNHFLATQSPSDRLSFLPSCHVSNPHIPSLLTRGPETTAPPLDMLDLPLCSESNSESDSDSVSPSVVSHDIDPDISLGFPRPPSMAPPTFPSHRMAVLRDPVSGTSLVTEQETGAVREFLRQRWATRLKAKQERRRLATPGIALVQLEASADASEREAGTESQKTDPDHDGRVQDASWEAKMAGAEPEPNTTEAAWDDVCSSPSMLPVMNAEDSSPEQTDMVYEENADVADSMRDDPGERQHDEDEEYDEEQEEDAALVLRFLKAFDDVDDGCSIDLEERVEGIPARAESCLELMPAVSSPSHLQRSSATSWKNQFRGLFRDEDIPFANLNGSNAGCRLPGDTGPVSIRSSTSFIDRQGTHPYSRIPKIIRKVASMKLGEKENEASAGGDMTLPSKRSSALIRLDASIAKLRAHQSTRNMRSQANPRLRHVKSSSVGYARSNREKAFKTGKKATPYKTVGSHTSSPPRLSPKRSPSLAKLDHGITRPKSQGPKATHAKAKPYHHLKSQSLGSLSRSESSRNALLNGTGRPHDVSKLPVPHKSLSPPVVNRARSFAFLGSPNARYASQFSLATSTTTEADAKMHELGPPFLPCPMECRVDCSRAHGNGGGVALKSFIDITPEQKTKRVSSGLRLQKQRVKKFLARASGVMSWGRFLSAKA
jgi:hypothetical protein